MGKRKKLTTLTKIEIASLLPKTPTALSQHEYSRRGRIATTVGPLPRLTTTPPPELTTFSTDPPDLTECFYDEMGDEGISEGFFSARVRVFF